MDSVTDVLRQQILSLHPMDELALSELLLPWKEVCFKRKQPITRTGETEKYLFLVLEGVQRAYITHREKDAVLVFSYPYSFSGIVDSFFLQQPSMYELETITESRMLRIHYHEFHALMLRHRSIETWVREALTIVLAGTLQRQIELIAYSAEEKFTALLRRSPQVLNLVPHKQLAAYIGMDPTNFSKLLGRVKI